MLCPKLNQRYGSLHVFPTVVVLFGFAQVLMTFPTATSGLLHSCCLVMAGAALCLRFRTDCNNYHGTQQATALGALGSSPCLCGRHRGFLIAVILG